MDKLDMALLELLEEDARRTPEQVGVLLGLSAAEAKARMDGLEAPSLMSRSLRFPQGPAPARRW